MQTFFVTINLLRVTRSACDLEYSESSRQSFPLRAASSPAHRAVRFPVANREATNASRSRATSTATREGRNNPSTLHPGSSRSSADPHSESRLSQWLPRESCTFQWFPAARYRDLKKLLRNAASTPNRRSPQAPSLERKYSPPDTAHTPHTAERRTRPTISAVPQSSP